MTHLMGTAVCARGPWVGTLAAVCLHHSPSFVPCVLYHGVLYSVLALSSTTPWPGLAADVMCATSQNLSPLLLSTSHIVMIS